MILNIIYLTYVFGWTVYSYSQIDLNLTLSANQSYQYLQDRLIQLGYFNRPLSTGIFLILLLLSFIFYLLSLRQVIKNRMSARHVVWSILLTTVILLFSYPAFSHDIFNYMFDAKIVTKYNLNPYFYKATDFPNDLWIRFMHWTHRTYPYGPIWLLLTLPLSWLGAGRFVITLFLFKLLFSFFHLGNTYLIYKILSKVNPKYSLLGVVFYGLNPLILIESLISPHNEVMMLFFLLWALYFFQNQVWKPSVFLLLSAGIKFITIVLLPLIFLRKYFFKKIDPKTYLRIILIIIILPIILEIFYREPYPWYFIILIGIGALLIDSRWLVIILIGLSIGSLLRYAPYLYFGDYTSIVSLWQSWLFILPIAVAFIVACYNAYKSHLWKLF